MKKRQIFVILLIIMTGVLYWFWAGDVDRQIAEVERVVDGDTIDLGGVRARLVGINSPEKTMPLFSEAKDFLTGLIEGKMIEIENYGSDKYGRILVHVFIEGRHVNKLMIENGFAHLYYYEHDEHYDDLSGAQELARERGVGIWERSENADCVELVGLKWDEPEELVLDNGCGELVQVIIKDEATHIFKEVLVEGENVFNFSHTFNNDGDSLFVWDEGGRIIVYYSY